MQLLKAGLFFKAPVAGMEMKFFLNVRHALKAPILGFSEHWPMLAHRVVLRRRERGRRLLATRAISRTTSEIRSSFLDFFQQRDHLVLPSSSLIPKDPSLLFTNAGA